MSNDMSCDTNVAERWPKKPGPSPQSKSPVSQGHRLGPICTSISHDQSGVVRSPGLFSNLNPRVINKPWLLSLTIINHRFIYN